MQDAQLSFTHLIMNASFLVQLVMFILVVMSVVSWTIIIQRSSVYKNGRLRADAFEDLFWSGIDLSKLYRDCSSRIQSLAGMELIFVAGYKEFVRLMNSGPADQEVVMNGTYRQMKVAESREIEYLEAHLATLATIGSISPYIGLFGTVWGIMHAFVSLAAVKNATLAMVAPPIAEALIATAMGLFAAIPAVMFYNHFVTKSEALENRYDNFMDEFATILNRKLVVDAASQTQPQVRSQAQPQPQPRQQVQMQPQNAYQRTAYAQDQAYQRPRAERQSQAAPARAFAQPDYASQQGTAFRQPQPRQAAAPGGRTYNPQSAARANYESQPQSASVRPYEIPGSRRAVPPQEDSGPHYITPGVAGDSSRNSGQGRKE